MRRLQTAGVLAFLSACLAGLSPVHSEDAIPTTCEFGITVTQNELLDVVQEAADFWPAVRFYVESNRFNAADPKARKQAAGFLKRLHEQLQSRLLGDDQAAAHDLLNYLAMRLRKTLLLREMREIVADDAALARLFLRWEDESRHARLLPAAERGAALKRVLAQLSAEMAAANLSAEKSERLAPLWERLAQCTERQDDTASGQVVLAFEREALGGDAVVAELLRGISAAVEWAQVVRPEKAALRRADFQKAWEFLARIGPPRVAAHATRQAGSDSR